MKDESLNLFVNALADAVAGTDDPMPTKGLADAYELIVARGKLANLGAAAVQIVLQRNRAKLVARRAVLVAQIPTMPKLH